MEKYFGKYRGKVIDDADPKKLGRLQVSVPVILGELESWAMPCVPYAGKNVGFFALPPVDANVWVEFEGGNLNYPIWSGCFWGEGEFLVEDEIEPDDFKHIKVFKTEDISLTFNDTADHAVVLESKPKGGHPTKITLQADGLIEVLATTMQFDAEKEIALKGSEIYLNDTALEVE